MSRLEDNVCVPILVVGDVYGHHEQLCKEIEKIVSKTKSVNFQMVFICGSFFDDSGFPPVEQLAEHFMKVPIPCYVVSSLKEQVPEEEINNLTIFDKFGVFSTAEGLNIAYLGGVEGKASTSTSFNLSDVKKLIKCCEKKRISVLFTYQWPAGLTGCEKGSKLVGYLVSELKPCIHVAAMERKDAQLAFQHGNTPIITQFTGLTDIKKSLGKKWIIALNVPVKEQSVGRPTIDYPFDYVEEFNKTAESNVFYDLTPRKRSGPKSSKPRKRPDFDISECWFCLSSPKVEKHLIISMGDETYLALAKGGLVNNHLLILPVNHCPSLKTASDEILKEVTQYMKSLKALFNDQNKTVVFFERAYKTYHFQVNCVAISSDVADYAMKKYENFQEKYGLTVRSYPEGTNSFTKTNDDPYLFAYYPARSTELLITGIQDNIPVSFDRESFADALKNPKKVNWRNCVLDDDETEQLVARIKKEFSKYDFTIN